MSEEAICICEKHDFYDFFPNNEKTKCPCCEVEHLTEQLNGKQDALSAALLALDNAVEQCVGLEVELARYKQGVEVDGLVAYENYPWPIRILDTALEKFHHECVRVLVMKVEE